MKLPNFSHTGLTRFDRNIALGIYYGYSVESILKYVRRNERIKQRGYDEAKEVDDCFSHTGFISTKAEALDPIQTIATINARRLHSEPFPYGELSNHEAGEAITRVMMLPIFKLYLTYIQREIKR